MFDLILSRDVNRHVVGQRHRFGLRLLLQNRDLRLEIGRLNVGDQSPLETRSQPLLERGNFVRRTVAAEDDLLLRVVQRVEGVEELGLRAFLAGEELDVVDEQHVDASIALAEIDDAVVADGVDHLVHEPLGRDVGELEIAIVLQHVVPDRVHQVRLAEPHAAVDEQRVVRARRRFGDRAAGRVRELIRRADDEGVEGVAGIEACRAWRRWASEPVRPRAPRLRRGARAIMGASGCESDDEIDRQARAFHLGHRLGDDRRSSAWSASL